MAKSPLLLPPAAASKSPLLLLRQRLKFREVLPYLIFLKYSWIIGRGRQTCHFYCHLRQTRHFHCCGGGNCGKFYPTFPLPAVEIMENHKLYYTSTFIINYNMIDATYPPPPAAENRHFSRRRRRRRRKFRNITTYIINLNSLLIKAWLRPHIRQRRRENIHFSHQRQRKFMKILPYIILLK